MRPKGTPGFVGHRLRQAREARGLTVISLADVLGITRQAISQYENGEQSPASEVMRRITETLNLPLTFFLKPLAQEKPGAIFYRSMSSATKASRARAERRYEWLREIVAYLKQFVQLPKVTFPDLDPPSDPATISESQIEELATATRRAWKLGDGPISNVAWLLENNGAMMARHELGADKLDAFSHWERSDDTPHIILGTDKGSAVRSRYDAAHELGHMVLHRKIPEGTLHHTNQFALIEDQAHRFAGAFLLPERTFSEEFYSASLDVLRSLKAKWKVSIAAMIKRAGQLRLIDDEQERRLWINLTRRGWRLKEPLDDELQPEEPRVLRRAIELLVDSNTLQRHEIVFQLSLPPKDVEDLVGLPNGYLSEPTEQVELLTFPVIDSPAVSDDKEDGDDQRLLPFPGTGRD